ncbi:MAG: hypothetical protein L0Z73_07445 [Gammaproteobacteria bacterium]|nr:hypothetical protein [Gammaproteobacteria bacterium]
MRKFTRGSVCAIVFSFISVFISGCNSDQSSSESKINKDLNKVLTVISQQKHLSRNLPAKPPAGGMLSEDHMNMYLWVNVRAMQLELARLGGANISILETAGTQPLTTDAPEKNSSSKISKLASQVDGIPPQAESDPDISLNESAALIELNFSKELFVWVKRTIRDTVAFIESAGETEIVALVTQYDPAIKHNITIVKQFRDKLTLSDDIQRRIAKSFPGLKATQTSALKDKIKLAVWPV